MNTTEAAQLLAHCAAFDNRKPSTGASKAWAAALHSVPLDGDTLAAVARYYGTPEESEPGGKWIQPHHVKTHRQALRNERGGPAGPGLGPTPPPADPDDTAAYLAALRTQQAQVAAGHLPREVPALPAGKDPAAYDTPAVRNLRARFEAAQEAARRRKAEEAAAEKTAIAAYLDAVKVLCNLDMPDRVAAMVERARDELLSDEQAALGFPLLAGTPGVTDEHRITVHAAGIAQRAESEAS